MHAGGVWELLFPGIETRVLGASPMFLVPGSREICLWMSAVDAAKRVAVNIINKFGLHLMVYPGGSDEIFETDPNSPVTTLIVRKGFIKLAIQTGCDIVPAFVFGEKWLYHRRPVSKAVQKFFMKHFRMPLIWFWGRYFTVSGKQKAHTHSTAQPLTLPHPPFFIPRSNSCKPSPQFRHGDRFSACKNPLKSLLLSSSSLLLFFHS